MGISDSDISRLLAGEIPADDPELGEVSTLLARMQTALPPVSPAACADRHLAVVTREARLVAAAREQDRRNTVPDRVRIRLRRALAAAGASLLVALTAGVGVATAMGVNPLQLVPGFVVGHPVSPETGLPGAGPADDRTDDPADGTEVGNPRTPVADPSVGTPSPADGQPTVTPTAGPSDDAEKAKREKADKEKAKKEKAKKEKADKSDEDDPDDSDDGNKGKGKGNNGEDAVEASPQE